MVQDPGVIEVPVAPGTEWGDRYLELSGRDVASLDPDELETLADAGFWVGRPRTAIEARQRAYRHHRDAKDHDRAARAAWRLFHAHFELDETAAAGGWVGRAQRHVDQSPTTRERGYVEIASSMWTAYGGDLDGAVELAASARSHGDRLGDHDLLAWGTAMLGGMLVTRGDVAEGTGHLDEAMLEATSGELSAFVTGWIYCFLLKTCQAIGDVARAVEWTDTAVRWCEARGVNSWYPGVCRLHRCEVASLRGEWDVAEREALTAAEELRPFGDYLIAHGQYIAGEIRLLRGRFDDAEAAFRRAHELGSDPQPGLALLRIAQGDTEGGLGQLRRAVAEARQAPLARARLLTAHVEAEVESDIGDVERARASVAELADVSERNGGGLMHALLRRSEGLLALATDEPAAALPLLREASEVCRQLELPYEAALVRLALGEAARRAGDEETARLEFAAARSAFERLGAAPDAERAATLAGGRDRTVPAGLSDREVEVLRLLAQGRSNRDIAEVLVLSEHTVRRHLSNSYRKIGVSSRAAATAFVFEHGLD